MALVVLRALHEAGRSIPGEVSVVGFDDMDESACQRGGAPGAGGHACHQDVIAPG
jgi:hypothetical protein